MSNFSSYNPETNSTQPLLAANQQIFINANIGTAVAAGSTGATVTTWTTASPGTLNVVSTVGFPDAGNLFVVVNTSAGTQNQGIAYLSYTGVTSTAFTGVVYVTGPGVSTVATHNAVVCPNITPPTMTGVADQLVISAYSDQTGVLSIYQSFNGTNYDLCDSATITALEIQSSTLFKFDNVALAPYLLFVYTNGSVAQNIFRFFSRLYGTGRQGA